MFSPITLDALRTLDAIDRRKSFAAAAEELYRVPSALSYTISKLEEELGVEIFDRSRRKAELTPVGRLILEQGRDILLATEELTQLARQKAEGWEVELTLCIDSLISYEPVFELIAEFQQIQPRVKVRLLEEVLGGGWDALNSERCDLVIGAPGASPARKIETFPLGEVVFEFAVAAGHPLTRLAQPIALEQVRQFPTVVVADSSRHLPVRSTGLLDGRSRITVPSMQKKIEAQINGVGVGYLPVHMISRALDEKQLIPLTLSEIRDTVDLHLAWRRGPLGKGAKWFIERLQQYRFDPQQGLVRI
ncbi:LysR family transcriptional regulator [Neptuniibacter halophilus]|uniref:LysR family transcriptional regulator n=1 Tax=Neptuniibacter halophilus TaxID=651666 RepID=UPI002573A5F0|nr:LysR family transcriptional regulator [Neptuniibacter halophilus]